jgi:hypothetical protein
MSTIMDDYIPSRREYSYDEVAKAMAVADEKINEILEPILERFDKETKIIDKVFDKVSYIFSNEEEKARLIEKFEKAKSIRDKSEYSDYIKLSYEISFNFFDIHCHISRGRFAEEQRRKIAQTIIIDFALSDYVKFTKYWS